MPSILNKTVVLYAFGFCILFGYNHSMNHRNGNGDLFWPLVIASALTLAIIGATALYSIRHSPSPLVIRVPWRIK